RLVEENYSYQKGVEVLEKVLLRLVQGNNRQAANT
ncbi:unnamed protein product, partial [marine sediment metagenome]